MKKLIIVILLAASVDCGLASASVEGLTTNLTSEVLTDAVPFVFKKADFVAEDFKVEWKGPALKGVDLELEKGSLEWIRVMSQTMLLPRARLIVKFKDIEKGQLEYGGFIQALDVKQGHGVLPVALLSDSEDIVLTFVQNGSQVKGTARIVFSPDKEKNRVFFDPSCSKFNMEAEVRTFKRDTWMYVGCRLVHMGAEGPHHKSSLEMFVYWDNVGQSIGIDGIATKSKSVSVWPLRLLSRPGRVSLDSTMGDSLDIRYSVSEDLPRGSIGWGLGPYQYVFQGAGKSVGGITPILTVYGGYMFGDDMRLLFFNATAVHPSYYTDMGVYFSTEQLRVLDDRLVMHLLLGAHALGFEARGRSYFIFGGPQGMEIMFKDFLKKGHNILFGSFIYPHIDDRAYYNVWLRWGTSKFFAEVNYISWHEIARGEHVYSKSLGVCFGMPLFRFF